MRIGGKKWAAPFAVVGFGTVCAAVLVIVPSAEAQQQPSTPQQQDSPQQQGTPRRGSHSRTDAQGNVIPVVFSADEVTYDDPLGLVIARGNVEISQAGQTVLADVVQYNQHTDTVTATGHVTIIRATGETVNAEYADLTNQLNDGFIQDIRTLLADRSRLVGNTARRTGNGNRTEIRKGVYSPCDLCANDPSAPPLWQLQAETIIHNKEQQLVEYTDVTLDLDGWPVLYSPYLSHPDPTVKRASGFLPPSIGESSFLGAFVKVPYYWVIDEDSDLTFAPMYTTSEGPVAEGEYRQRFSNGELYFQGSFTQGKLVDQNGDLISNKGDEDRGNVFAYGQWDLDDQFRAGFIANRASDQTYLELYRLGGTQAFLTSRAYLEDFDGRDYGAINSYNFQSLQEGVSDHTQAIVLPSVDYTWAGEPMSWGGKFTTNVSGIDILRETGTSSQRLSAGTQFDLPFFGPWGERFNFVAGIRGDTYDVRGAQLTQTITQAPLNGVGLPVNQVVPTGPLVNGIADRIFPQVGLEWNYPWISRGSRTTFIIEPRIAVYAAPNGENPSKIPNNDSQAISFSDTDLFVRDRFTGYDLVDSGQRVDYGIQGLLRFDTGESLSFLTGQSYRFENSSPFAGQTFRVGNQPPISFGTGDGLDRQLSDYVGRIVYTPSQSLDVIYRYRFDQQDLRPQTQEVAIATGTDTVRVNTGLIDLGNNLADNESHRLQVSAGLSVQLNPYWSLTANGTRDLAGDGNLVASGFGVQYSDECLTFLTSFTQNDTRFEDIRPSQALIFTFVLKNLGVIGLPAVETGGL
jgi:LPS-assembly protein